MGGHLESLPGKLEEGLLFFSVSFCLGFFLLLRDSHHYFSRTRLYLGTSF